MSEEFKGMGEKELNIINSIEQKRSNRYSDFDKLTRHAISEFCLWSLFTIGITLGGCTLSLGIIGCEGPNSGRKSMFEMYLDYKKGTEKPTRAEDLTAEQLQEMANNIYRGNK